MIWFGSDMVVLWVRIHGCSLGYVERMLIEGHFMCIYTYIHTYIKCPSISNTKQINTTILYQLPRPQYLTQSSTYKTAYTDGAYILPLYHTLRRCTAFLENF